MSDLSSSSHVLYTPNLKMFVTRFIYFLLLDSGTIDALFVLFFITTDTGILSKKIKEHQGTIHIHRMDTVENT